MLLENFLSHADSNDLVSQAALQPLRHHQCLWQTHWTLCHKPLCYTLPMWPLQYIWLLNTPRPAGGLREDTKTERPLMDQLSLSDLTASTVQIIVWKESKGLVLWFGPESRPIGPSSSRASSWPTTCVMVVWETWAVKGPHKVFCGSLCLFRLFL